MTDLLTLTQPLTGGAVTHHAAGANMTVDVAAGTVLVANGAVAFSSATVTVTAADATLYRIDAVVVNSSGTVSVTAGTLGNEIGNTQPPDTTGYALLAYVLVVPSTDPEYTGTITDAKITDQRIFTTLPEPGQTFAYTFNAAALSLADPGAMVCGFDSTTAGSVAHLYVSYQTASVPAPTYSLKTWLQGGASGTPILPWYLRLWSRSQPNVWILVKVTAFADHATYCDLTVTRVATSVSTTAVPLLTVALDTILEFAGAVPVTSTPTGTLIKRTVYTSGSAATHTFDATCTTARIQGVGAGGGGGSVATGASSAIGSGGGAGGFFDVLVSLGGATTATYTVGTKGTGGASAGAPNSGNDGGDTTVVLGATTYTGGKGHGGLGMAVGSSGVGVVGGTGGTVTNGDIQIPGEAGAGSGRIGASPFQCFGGEGGDSELGMGGTSGQGVGPGDGANGTGHGSGGAGGLAVNTGAHKGGDGTDGLVIIEEYT